ncbi:uncharacterized protein LOC108452170 [Gossypium arboreum]|uniref:Transmembrane protein n=1 Tax=Gossypium arboreum TaxID=29729 RepID=A0ABR0Q1J9_GOSAR|nr:uncharacterized protein LOC108452170 [Gossypium arboreum]KAK5832927.1 hypothetical protein PVK06_016735 [Gossypium arboreum]
MLGLVSCIHPQIPSASPNLYFNFKYAPVFLKPQIHIPKHPSRSFLFAQNGNKDDLTKQPNKKPQGEEKQSKVQPEGSFNGNDGGESRNERRSMFNFRLGDLLDPDPDNIVALGLTGLLTWASVQVLWQLFFISGAILLAALKYSFIAALLLFILITLL